MIVADSEYVFQQGDIKAPSGFLAQVLVVSGLPVPTESPPTTSIIDLPRDDLPGWAVAIIVILSTAIILIPCWILLCVSFTTIYLPVLS